MKDNSLRVLFVADRGILGGAAKSLIELTTTLKQKEGIDICVCISNNTTQNDVLRTAGIKTVVTDHPVVMEVPPKEKYKGILMLKMTKHALMYFFKSLVALRNLEKQLNVSSFDIVHTNSARVDMGCMISRKYGIPHVVHIREFGVEDFGCFYLRPHYPFYLNKFSKCFVAVSEAVKKNWAKKGINEEKINVIYNGVDQEGIISANRLEIINSLVLRLVSVGGVVEPKGQLQIIQAINHLSEKEKKRVVLDIYGWGDSEYIEVIKKEAIRGGIDSNIHFHGAVDTVTRELYRYHVGLTCSKQEAFGRSTAEYMHAGLGIIVSDTGANKELISDNVTGLVYRYGDVVDLSNKIKRLLNDRELICRLGDQAQKIAQEKFTKERNASRIHDMYKEVLKNEKRCIGS